MDMETHPLKHEILKCQSTGSPMLPMLPKETEMEMGIKTSLKEKHLGILDQSQKDAYKYALGTFT